MLLEGRLLFRKPSNSPNANYHSTSEADFDEPLGVPGGSGIANTKDNSRAKKGRASKSSGGISETTKNAKANQKADRNTSPLASPRNGRNGKQVKEFELDSGKYLFPKP